MFGSRILAALPLVVACAEPRPTVMEAPAVIRRALSGVSALEATAELVDDSGDRNDPIALERGADGVSFSGFIPAEPGRYRLEVVFRGQPAGRSDLLFLGRWISDELTVSAGATASPQFSRPVDTLGRPEDGGDPDGDDFGNLDEILWGTDPSVGDTDGDGVLDGHDCDPVDGASAFSIATGGTVEDCDGDGVSRPDRMVGGTDCDDRNPAIHPGLVDDCGSGLDEDCNPSTCPVNDVMAPVISSVDPPDGSTVGCHTKVSATIRDDGNVGFVSMYLAEPVPGQPVTLVMQRTAGEVFEAPPFNLASTINGLSAGRHAIEVRAQDSGGNMSSASMSYDFAFDIPAITSMTPAMVGSRSQPFTLDIQATSARAVLEVRLMSIVRGPSGTYQADLATEIGRSASASGSFTIDPSAFENGEHLLFPIVTDAAGNQLRPDSITFPTGGNDGLEANADYRCIQGPTPAKLPVRVLVVGQDGYQPSTMMDLFDQAVSTAQATDPAAELVSIIGFGVGPDGRVGLDDASSYTKRWQFAFWNPSTMRAVTVSWYTPAFTTTNPVVDPNAGNVTASDPFPNPAALVDSPTAVDAYGKAGCPAVAGTDDDWILYHVVDQQPVFSIYSASGSNWRGTATPPIAEIFACQ